MADVHVVPAGDRWKIEADGVEVGSFDTQEQAIGAGRDAADAHSGELVIHGRDGKIREKDSHGNDPRDIPG